ncbi:putative zinc-binding metallopeptidase [Uliginosibacterium sp. sgz301328]|uniref:zinc-binding metallopeptidase family protein n=1 Tax=Uliginosibacterium sp. sgz301328 TaxID=3243764 RepID=UPI00359E0399
MSPALGIPTGVTAVPALRRAWRCTCGQPVFFRNSQCLACGRALGYEPNSGLLSTIEPADDDGGWRLAADTSPRIYRRCANLDTPAACNWLVEPEFADLGDESDGLCMACRLNDTIPDLGNADNGVLWGRIEQAKRRLVSQLITLGLPVASRLREDPANGLMFEFLRTLDNAPPVVTGHSAGVITINVLEADDVERERMRTALREPYRTLLGHLRHEVGHYYWDRLVADTAWHQPFRALFGDERQDYAEALNHHYEAGPPADWPQHFVSAYASVHPWEDWAETWAHYLHMIDSLATANSFGLDADYLDLQRADFTAADIGADPPEEADSFLHLLASWLRLTGVMNELCRSMGQPDFYPFVLPASVARKLYFVDRIIGSHNLARSTVIASEYTGSDTPAPLP